MLFTIIARLFTKLGEHGRNNVEVYKLFMKFDMEKFDGRINFDIWQVQVKDAVTQSGLYKLRVEAISICPMKGIWEELCTYSWYVHFAMEEDMLLLTDPQVWGH